MRKYLRAKAHYAMEKAGLQHINKPVRVKRGEKGISKFAELWRKYC